MRSLGGRVFTFRTEPIDAAARSAYLRREVRNWAGFLAPRRLIELAVAFVILLVVASFLIGNLRPVPGDWVRGAICAGGITGLGFVLAWAIAWHVRRRYPRLIAGLPLACPACTYDLAGLEPAPDGCTVCPECGGAWRMLAPCGD
ncbi:MAG: hypothetical protein DHS20C14_22120 [Phycisphaeraceae bacterium]|nr:MAG: hypothetical protein DHS20C14_22120 [Phycisphaeraceae bacterium]